jgi:hypothetical protein
VDDKQMAQIVGAVRTGVGSALLVAPGFAGRVWVGPDADGPGTKVFARAVGARDVLLGLRTMDAVRSQREARHWLVAGFAADAADVVATLIAWRSLTPGRRVVMPLVAAAVATLGYLAAQTLD